MFENKGRAHKVPADEGGNGEFAFNNFDQSERFDDSMVKAGGPVDMLGVSIDSQSIDQSLINQSISSKRKMRKLKQKEDLDGSRVYRDRDQVEESP